MRYFIYANQLGYTVFDSYLSLRSNMYVSIGGALHVISTQKNHNEFGAVTHEYFERLGFNLLYEFDTLEELRQSHPEEFV